MLKPDLPPGVAIRIEVFLETPNTRIGHGIVEIEREPRKPASFSDVGVAVQAGVYEALRSIWPEQLDGLGDLDVK